MAIYGRFGVEIIIKRRAVLGDVQKLDNRKPDKQDREAIKAGSYWVVDFVGTKDRDGRDRLYHLAYLRADGGIAEIDAACKATEDGKTSLSPVGPVLHGAGYSQNSEG